MSDLVNGLYPKQKSSNAPDFVLCKLSINVQQFREWFGNYLKEHPGEEWVNLDLKVSRAGKGYAQVDTWKPSGEKKAAAPEPEFADSDIPF